MCAKKRSLGPKPLLYPEPALLICTYDNEGKPNVMTAAWGGISCSEPLSLSVGVRPSRWTHEPALSRKAFTVCIANEGLMQATDMAGIVSGRRHDKFKLGGFTPVKSDLVDAPYIAECPVVLECSLAQHYPLGAHTLLIGNILDVKVDEDCLTPEGAPDITRIAPLIYDSGSQSYYGIGRFLGKAFSVGKALIPHGE